MKRLSPSTRHIEYSKYARAGSRVKRGGFTLVELLVVIAIAAILSALLLGGFFNMSASNKRLSCQTNLQTIYGALRMYAADNDGGYPYFNASSANGGTTSASTPEDTRFGLWGLYTNDMVSTVKSPAVPSPNDKNRLSFPNNRVPNSLNTPDTDLTDNPVRPISIYLRNSGSLHCPADIESTVMDDDGNIVTPDRSVSHEELYSNGSRTRFNPNYLSYQTLDGNTATYQSQRDVNPVDPVTLAPNPLWKRQLTFFNGTQRVFDQRAASNAVITWCKWHRTGLGGRQLDPILFADGSVRTKPVTAQPGWQRTNN